MFVVLCRLQQAASPDDAVPDSAVWAACLFFVCACAYRLARFNVTDIHAPKHLAEAAIKEQPIAADSPPPVNGAVSPRAASLRRRSCRLRARG